MALSRRSGWAGELERWLAPFLAALSRPEQRRRAPVYLKGLLLSGERKSVGPMAARVAPDAIRSGRSAPPGRVPEARSRT